MLSIHEEGNHSSVTVGNKSFYQVAKQMSNFFDKFNFMGSFACIYEQS